MEGRHVLITGATGGLGRHVTKAALLRGARVTASHHREGSRSGLLDALGEGDRDRLELVRADLRREDDVARLVDSLPRLDALLHLVGAFEMGPLHELSLEDWRAHHELNLTTTFLCCKHALRRMREAGYGRIVTVGSKAVEEPMANAACYSSAKAGVVALTRAIAAETKGTDVTANCVLPSIIDTEANRQAMGEDQADRWVPPAELAEAILFLASEAAGPMRGAQLAIDGQL